MVTMFADCDRTILDQFASTVRQQFPDAQIWAFGSRARGDAKPDSDLDICVVVDSLEPSVKKTISYIAWEIGFYHERLITTVKYSRDQFDQGPCSISPLVQTIRCEGIAV